MQPWLTRPEPDGQRQELTGCGLTSGTQLPRPASPVDEDGIVDTHIHTHTGTHTHTLTLTQRHTHTHTHRHTHTHCSTCPVRAEAGYKMHCAKASCLEL